MARKFWCASNGTAPVSALAWNGKGTWLAFAAEDGDAGLLSAVTPDLISALLGNNRQPASVDPRIIRGRPICLQVTGNAQIGWDLLLASLLVAAGLVICGVSLIEISRASVRARTGHAARAASTPDASDANKAPAESKPGGARPTTPAPEPARPAEQAQKEAPTRLPPAPAEKIAPPIQQE